MRTVKDIMTVDCVTASPTETVHEVALKMRQHDIGFMPVLEGKKLIGVVTDRDMTIRGYAEKKADTAPISHVMSSENIATITPDTSVEEAAQLMAKHQVRRLPVVENGELIGVVAIGDLAVRENFEDEAGQALSKISEPV